MINISIIINRLFSIDQSILNLLSWKISFYISILTLLSLFLFFSRQLFSSNNEEVKSNETNENEQGMKNTFETNIGDGNKVHINELMENLNKKQRRLLSREYERQGNECCLRTNIFAFLVLFSSLLFFSTKKNISFVFFSRSYC